MKRFTLVLTVADSGSLSVSKLKSVSADTLMELCSKFPLIIAEMARDEQIRLQQEVSELTRTLDDDIPF